MGTRAFCDMCGKIIQEEERLPMGIGVPQDRNPRPIQTPMGMMIQIPPHDPNNVFETFDLCRPCGLELALQLKHNKKRFLLEMRIDPSVKV